MFERPLERFMRPTTRLTAARLSFVVLLLLLVLVVLSRAPSDAPRPINAAERAASEEMTAPTAGVDRDSARQALDGTVAAETSELPLTTGCFRSGSSRDEVRAVMGAPDTVVFGAWEYGRSSVTFGYGVVLDYSNQGGNLRLC